MTKTRCIVWVVFGLVVVLLSGTPLAAEWPDPGVRSTAFVPPDRDGDGRPGEEQSIVERARLYAERHGGVDSLTSTHLLDRARWVDARRRQLSSQGVEGNGWISLGPTNGAGRAAVIAPHPVIQDTLLVGTAGGGVWRTRDGGATWEPLTDHLPDLSVGALQYAPSDPSVVYLGTGEGGGRSGTPFIPGIGLLRSFDSGDTWVLPDTPVASFFYRISIDPRDELGFLAATDQGLLRTTDGGVTWSTVISDLGLRAVADVVRAPDNPDLLWASLFWETSRSASDRILRSTDNGLTWTSVGQGLPDAESHWAFNRISIAVAPTDPRRLYAALTTPVEDEDDPPRARLFMTTDGGDSWSELTEPSEEYPYLWRQGWYDNTLAVDPQNPLGVFAGGVWYVRTTDGGQSWQHLSSDSGFGDDGIPHVDAHHVIWQGPTLWVACDGGVWRSDDRGLTWTDRNNGLITRQYYGIGIDPVHRERVIAGAQDNGTGVRRDSGDNLWDIVIGGDGIECAINPWIPDVMYGSIQYTRVQRSTDGGVSFTDVSPPFDDEAETASFYTPVTLRPNRPWEVFTATSYVWISPDAGNSWRRLGSATENGEWSTDRILQVAVTPADDRVVMVAKGRAVYRTSDGGGAWRITDSRVGLPERIVNHVTLSPFDADAGIACLAGQYTDNLWRTTDGGATWHPASTGLPPFSVQVARWDPTDPDVIFAGTDVGLYRSVDRGLNWAEYGDGLPAVSIHDIRLLPDGSMLRVGTHGRGVWQLNIERPENTKPEIEILQPTALLRLNAGETASFTARVTDNDGDPLRFGWIFTDQWQAVSGRGEAAATATADHVFEIAGRHLAGVHARDSKGGWAATSLEVSVEEPADDCDQPRALNGGGPFPVVTAASNATARPTPSDPLPACEIAGAGFGGLPGSMWFELTPQTSHRYRLIACRSGSAPVLSMWTGDRCGSFTVVAGGCDHGGATALCPDGTVGSAVEVDLDGGETYRVLISETSAQLRGIFELTLECLDGDCPTAPEEVERLRRPARRVRQE